VVVTRASAVGHHVRWIAKGGGGGVGDGGGGGGTLRIARTAASRTSKERIIAEE
jgi:hypothetical protein